MGKYDAIILGAGQSGMPLAKQIAGKGLTVALVEERLIGGTCINDGCSPTKTMVASARIAHLVSRAEDFGVPVSQYSVDQKAVKARKDHIVNLFRGGAEKSLRKSDNIEIFMGKGTFVSKNEIKITLKNGGTKIIQAKKIFINTGSKPLIPPLDGLEDLPYLTSTSIMELEETPRHLLILGGGYVGLEFAQMFRRFGSKVTLLDAAERLVPKEDKDVCEEVGVIFEKEGIHSFFRIKATKLAQKEGEVILTYQDKSGNTKEISGSHILIATGRKPSTGDFGLENLGIKTAKSGHIKVNARYETNIKGIYALGDVAGSPPFTHMAYHDAYLAFQSIYEGKKVSNKNRPVPYCVFIDPQLARVGLNEQQAIKAGIDYKVGKFWMKHAGRALEVDEKEGFFKVLVDPKSKKILGASILSIDGGEIMAILQMAMLGGITYDKIARLPIAHPTLAESLNNLMRQVK